MLELSLTGIDYELILTHDFSFFFFVIVAFASTYLKIVSFKLNFHK